MYTYSEDNKDHNKYDVVSKCRITLVPVFNNISVTKMDTNEVALMKILNNVSAMSAF